MPSLRPNSKPCRVTAATSTSRVRRPDVCCKRPESATSRSTSSIATSASPIRLPASTPSIKTEHRQLETKLFFDALARGDFDVAIDFITDHGDDPNLQYVHVLSTAMRSPMSYSQHSDTNIDALFERQKRALDLAERKRATREFEQYAIGQAYNIMLFWWQRIVVYNKRVNGWRLTPSHYLGNDLTQVWLEP